MRAFARQRAQVERHQRVVPVGPDRARPGIGGSRRIAVRDHGLGNQAVQRLLQAGTLQAKLAVGPPGDRFEQEADRVAEQVTRIAGPDGHGWGTSRSTVEDASARQDADREDAAHPQPAIVVRRRCAGCEEEELRRQAIDEEEEPPSLAIAEEDEDLRRQTVDEEDEEEDEEAPLRTKRAPDRRATATPSLEAEVNSLRGGGQPLLPAVRAFFESRFGYSFGDVRIHTGPRAAASAHAVNALAYTVGHDVVFSAGQYAPETAAGRRLLAHELTHVIQQQPLAARRPADRHAALSPATPGVRPPRLETLTPAGPAFVLQRFAPYWEPYDYNGTRTHGEVLPKVGKENSIFTEAPVPNASRLGAELLDKVGAADFYRATRQGADAFTVGLRFAGSQRPARLNPTRGHQLMYAGVAFPHHRSKAAPFLADDLPVKITRLDQAPDRITLADLKPHWQSIEAVAGTEQLDSYAAGFETARDETNELVRTRPHYFVPRPQGLWELEVGRFSIAAPLRIPNEYVYNQPLGAARSGPSRPLVLKQNGKIVQGHRQRPLASGRLYVAHAPRPGILSYFWIPDSPVDPRTLPASVQRLGQEVVDLVIDPLVRRPISVAPARGQPKVDSRRERQPLPIAQAPGEAPRTLRRRATRSVPRVSARDGFDLPVWQSNHRRLTASFQQSARTPEFEDARTTALVVDAHRATERALDKPLPGLRPTAVSAASTYRKIEFWTGRESAGLGRLRQVMGRTFVKLVDQFGRAADRLGSLLRSTSGSRRGGGIEAAALRVAAKVAKLAAGHIIRVTTHRLAQSLAKGLETRLLQLLDTDQIDQLNANIQAIRERQQGLEEWVDNYARTLVDPFRQTLETLNDVQKLGADIAAIIRLVKWGMRVVACLSPPAWGCLWIVLQAVGERILQEIIESCWFQDKVAPLITELRFLREDVPNRLAEHVIAGVNTALPAPLKGVFAPLDPTPVAVSAADLPCDSTDVSERQAALQHLLEAVGEERLEAFGELSRKHGIRSDASLTVVQIRQIEQSILASGVSAGEMQRYAEAYPNPPSDLAGKLVGVTEFLNAVRTTVALGGGEAGAPGSETPEIVADARRGVWSGQEQRVRFRYRVVEGIDATNYRRDRVRVTLSFSYGDAEITARNVECRVIKRASEGNEVSMTLQLLATFQIDLLPYRDRWSGLPRWIKLREGGKVRHTITLAPRR